MRRFLLFLALAACSSNGGGGGGDGDGDGDGDADTDVDAAPDAFEVDPATCSTEEAVRANVIAPAGCASLSCHDAQNPAEGLDLQSTDLAGRLVDLTARPPCNDPILVPGDSAASYLLEKVEPSPGCGVQMPTAGRPKLSGDQIDCLANWIDSL